MSAMVFAMTKDMNRECWVDVPSFEGLYMVSNTGLVKSLPRNGTKGCILKQHTDRYGYAKVVLRKEDKPHYYTVHRLVAKSFIPNPHNKNTVNHIDNNRRNNFAINLEWTTMKENLDHSHRQCRQVWNKKPLICFNVNTGECITFESQREAARALNLNQGTINNTLNGRGRAKKYKGWKFQYA